ncbi:MAG: CotH kinase family protein [Verrucomicrobiales bacterium]
MSIHGSTTISSTRSRRTRRLPPERIPPQGARRQDRHDPAWDFDRSMDSTDGRDDNFNVWRGQTGDEGTDFFRYTWWDRLFEDKNFWQRWLDRYTALRQSELSNANVHATIDGMAAEIGPAAARIRALDWLPAAQQRLQPHPRQHGSTAPGRRDPHEGLAAGAHGMDG